MSRSSVRDAPQLPRDDRVRARTAARLAASEASLQRLIGGYRPIAGIYDHMIGPDGAPRPEWTSFLNTLAGLPADELARRLNIADRYIARSGLVHRVYNDAEGAERKWPFSHMPVMISPEEWQELEAGVVQRAELMERVLADIYGAGQLFRDGLLPVTAVVGGTDFLRPVHGIRPRGGRFLRLYAADIGRGPDGRWWVLSDRAQSPSGAGYAVENRIAITRALPETYSGSNVHRLASFFAELRNSLEALNHGAETRVAVLTPGTYSETFVEQAFLARYLGMMLVEGADLSVRNDKVFVRTVSGLKRINVLLRRVDSDFCDPLELNMRSQLGIPGLVRALRAGNITIANALGSGVVESRSLMSFLPSISRRLLGEELKIPNLATWWCGQPAERRHVLENLDSLAIAPAVGTEMPELLPKASVPANQLEPRERARLMAAIERRGIDFVGQELVKLSTTPVLEGGRLTPKPVLLRLYVAATDSGWKVMPGGFARISERTDARYVTMQEGGQSADVWVHSREPVVPTTLLNTSEDSARRANGLLPSRSADNMFWLGRYMERTEATVRVVRALAERLVSASGERGKVIGELVDLLSESGATDAEDPEFGPAAAALTAMCRKDLPGAVPALARVTRNAASVIRDRLSPDAWATLERLVEMTVSDPGSVSPEVEALDRADETLRLIAAFSGYAQENMNRLTGWRFLEIGRRLERALVMCRWAEKLAPISPRADALDALLELGDSQITFRFRYQVEPGRRTVLDLLVLDSDNPRSVSFQLRKLVQHLEWLPRSQADHRLTDCQRIAVKLSAEIDTATDRTAGDNLILDTVRGLRELSDEIGLAYFTHRRGLTTALAGLA